MLARFFRPLFALFLLLASTPIHAQNLLSLHGYVVEGTGAAVPGVPLQLQTRAGANVARAESDSLGNFVLSGLKPGDYVIAVPAFSGFAARSVPVHLASSVSGFKIGLSLAAISQEVTVGVEPVMSEDAAANQDTVSMSGQELQKLPVFDMDYVSTMSTFLDVSSGSSGGTTIVVDGVEMKSSSVSPSAIQEVKINNDPYSAEFTRPGRGRIEITTKPGSPVFHGELNFLFLDSIFNAKSFPAVIKPPKVRRIFEGHLAGPVGRGGRTSFILSGSSRQRNVGVVVDAITPAGAVNENVLAPTLSDQANGRITHDFSANHRLSVGYSHQDYYETNSDVGGLTLREAGTKSAYREDDAIFNDRIIVTPNLINQLQVTLEKDEDTTLSLTNKPAIQVNGAFVGGGAQADLAHTENTIHVNEVASWSHGRHYLRAGIQLPQFSRRAVDDHSNRLGTYSYASLAAYAANTPYAFTAQQGVGRGIYWINEFGTFLQDQIKVTPRIEVSLGLRYDWQTFLPDHNNFSPRVSLAYAPGRGTTILRTGVGMFYDRTGGDFPATVTLHNGSVLRPIQILNPPATLPDFSSIPTSIVRFDPNVRAPYAIQYSVGIERQVHKSVTLTADYRGQVQVKSFRSRDANAPILPANPVLGAVYARPNTAYGQIQQIESGGRTLMNALDLGFRGDAGRWFSGQAQYTLSRFEGNTGGISWFPEDQYHPNAEWGRSSRDALQKFNLIGNINQGHWLSLGVNAGLTSGMPYNETTGTDDFHTGLGNARPAGVPRNALQGGGSATLDLLYTHEFFLTKATDENARVLTAGVSAFNVLNRSNYNDYIGTVSSPRFGQPTGAYPGRQMQFTVGYRF